MPISANRHSAAASSIASTAWSATAATGVLYSVLATAGLTDAPAVWGVAGAVSEKAKGADAALIGAMICAS